MVDKVLAKGFVAKKIGEEHIVPTLGVWKHFDEIDFDALPNQFVLKTNHSGGNTGVVICKDKKEFDYHSAKKKLERSLKSDISRKLVEWPYRNIERRILAETFLGEGIPFARVDLYSINGKIYFGEITFFPDSGFDCNRLPEADLYFGEKIKLPSVTR